MSEPSQTAQFEAVIRRYYDGCNRADREMMLSTLAPDAAHYFPAGAPQGPFLGAKAIADGWIMAVEQFDSRWTIDRLVVDARRAEAAVEWTHFKPHQNLLLRGAEWICFDVHALITEIRAYYACGPGEASRTNALGGFDYEMRGYPLIAPHAERAFAERRPAQAAANDGRAVERPASL